jgi:hypothetical protein
VIFRSDQSDIRCLIQRQHPAERKGAEHIPDGEPSPAPESAVDPSHHTVNRLFKFRIVLDFGPERLTQHDKLAFFMPVRILLQKQFYTLQPLRDTFGVIHTVNGKDQFFSRKHIFQSGYGSLHTVTAQILYNGIIIDSQWKIMKQRPESLVGKSVIIPFQLPRRYKKRNSPSSILKRHSFPIFAEKRMAKSCQEGQEHLLQRNKSRSDPEYWFGMKFVYYGFSVP